MTEDIKRIKSAIKKYKSGDKEMLRYIRNIESEDGVREILNELFDGGNSAISKNTKVRHTQYEIDELWNKKGMRLEDVSPKAKKYFSLRFLKGEQINPDPNTEKNKAAIKSLKYAVDSSNGRCKRLAESLNDHLVALGFNEMSQMQIEDWLNWLTFRYEVRKNRDGNLLFEPGYNARIEIRDFYDDKNRKEFWKITKYLLDHDYIMPMGLIGRIVKESSGQ